MQSATGDSRPLPGASGKAVNFDFEALSAVGLLAPGNLRLADEYRAIKQPILARASAADPVAGSRDRLLMVASALPGEGKTFTSVNLSLSLAQEKDWSVLLADADCKNPSLSRLLGMADQPGLLDYLRTPGAALSDYVLPTNFSGLSVLPVGSPDPNAAELLASARMQAMSADLASGRLGNLLVIFDSSPLLLTPEPLIVSRQVGQILLVVAAGSTSRPAFGEALNKLDPNKAIGLVLNRASSSDRSSGYGYGYGYGSSAYGSAPSAS
jgi:exopolysaccharide/PEP-CTERM locus tyrosine autokinase